MPATMLVVAGTFVSVSIFLYNLALITLAP